jgi:DNA repair protein RadC
MADRPREKLLAKGPKALTDAELLAIFLRVGRKGANAKQMAQELIDYFDGLAPLLKADRQTFCAAKGLGQAKFCQLQATLELTRRYLDEQLRSQDIFTSPEKVMDYLAIQMRDNHREVAKVALEKNASSVIVAHNHPSGSANPSRADILITKRLKAALEIIDIKLLDHFIIGKGEIVSLAGTGKL